MSDQANGTKQSAVICRVCGGVVEEFLDLGRQPLSDGFLKPEEVPGEFFFRLAVGRCSSCTMVQLAEEVPRDLMFRENYPYYSSGSSVMREHFAEVARGFLQTASAAPDPFIVEIGSNDGVMLKTIQEAGARHLGFEPSGRVAEVARADGLQVRTDFFQESTAAEVCSAAGPADVIYAANTLCHIPYLDSIFRGGRGLDRVVSRPRGRST